MGFGLSPVNTTDKLGSVIFFTNRVRTPTNYSDWINPGFSINEATVDGVSETKANNHYNFKIDFETMREIQDLEREKNSMSQPTLDSTSIGTNMTNRTMSPLDSIPVRTKFQSLRQGHYQQNFRCKMEKRTYQMTRT